MTCIHVPNGIMCVGNKPVEIQHAGKSFYFEWTAFGGWVPVNKDGTERRTRVPKAVWDQVLDIKHPC